MKKENANLTKQITELNQKIKENILEIMEYKHNIEMMNNDITQSELALKNKDSVIEQLRSQINEMNSEIDEKMKDLQIFEENNQREIDDYNNKIEELLQEKSILEAQNNELSQNLLAANDTLNEYNDIIINKYKLMENELQKEQQNRINMEEKYKDKIQSLKMKNNNLQQENSKLKNKKNFQKFFTTNNLNSSKGFINTRNFVNYESNYNDLTNVDNYMNRTMFNIKNIDSNNDFNGNLPINEIKVNRQSIMKNTISSYKNNKSKFKRNNNNKDKKNIFDKSQVKQKHMINEFKTLLNKIDEKLEVKKK